MDKITGEEDFKGLDEEIDDAVDRLFVESKRGVTRSASIESPLRERSMKPPLSEPSMRPPTLEPSTEPPMEPVMEPLVEPPSLEPSIRSPILEPTMKPPVLEPSMETSLLEPSAEFKFERNINLESSSRPSPTPSPASVSFLKSVEKMEAQLLSLEWEITDDKLKKTKEEVLALREVLKQKPNITSILNYMEEILNHMIKNEESIQPPWIKFLLDSKETIKLLMRKETDSEINIYKQLAHLGIDARFFRLEGIRDTKILPPSFIKGDRPEKAGGSVSAEKRTEPVSVAEKKIEDISNKMNLFMEKVENIFAVMKQQISKLEETAPSPPAPPEEAKPKTVNVTIFKINEKLFAVETEKVLKLFKLPLNFQQKYSDQSKIRLRDLEVRIINLRKVLSIPVGERTGEMRILAVKDNGECKGLMVDQVLKQLSTSLEKKGRAGEYFSGVIHSTYQEQPVEIPILDLKKF
jgi:chemotaxis signal transduction protein